MDIWTLLLMSAGLAMDAFAVSVSSGIVLCHTCWRQTVRISGSFGFFQGLMPLIGYTIARTFADKISAFDHWVAFGLLAFIGGKMLWEVFRGGEAEHADSSLSPAVMAPMAVATSIDALAVGASLAVMPRTGLLIHSWGYLICCLVIAVVTFVICFAGVKIGCRTGNFFGRKAEVIGGIVLILIGVKILLEHLGVLPGLG